MSTPYLGETCALLAALTWSFSLVLFKKSGESIPPLSLCLFKNVVGLVLLTITLLLVGTDQEALREMDPRDIAILAVTGVLGIAVADTLLFYSLNIIGVGLLTIVECCYTPSIIVCAWMFLSETIALADYIGGFLVLSAVFFTCGHKPPAGRTRRELLKGIFLGILAIMMMAAGIVFAKPIIEREPLLPVTLIRLVAGTVALAAYMAASPQRKIWFAVFKPTKAWRTCLPASVFSTYFAMLLWVGGFKYTQAAVAAILNQTSTIMALGFATVILKEPFTRRKLAAAILALSGIMIVLLW